MYLNYGNDVDITYTPERTVLSCDDRQSESTVTWTVEKRLKLYYVPYGLVAKALSQPVGTHNQAFSQQRTANSVHVCQSKQRVYNEWLIYTQLYITLISAWKKRQRSQASAMCILDSRMHCCSLLSLFYTLIVPRTWSIANETLVLEREREPEVYGHWRKRTQCCRCAGDTERIRTHASDCHANLWEIHLLCWSHLVLDALNAYYFPKDTLLRCAYFALFGHLNFFVFDGM